MWGWITPFMPKKQIDLAMWAKRQGMAVAASCTGFWRELWRQVRENLLLTASEAWGPFNWMRLDKPAQLQEHRPGPRRPQK